MSCTASPPCTFREVPLEDIRVEWDGPAVGRKAVAFPKLQLICIERRFWCSIPTVQGRAAILAHERGHIEGARCESCADVRAGEILRREGYPTPRDGFRALYSTLDNRDYSHAAEDLRRGFGLDDKVLHRERAAGVDARLQRFLDWWNLYGPFTVMVGVDGGLRDPLKQLELYAQGRRQNPDGSLTVVDPTAVVTQTLSSKHTRGEALDLWPVRDRKPVLEVRDSTDEQLYRQLGDIAKLHGFAWGGDWKGLVDRPHIEIPANPHPGTLAGGAPLAGPTSPAPSSSIAAPAFVAGGALLAIVVLLVVLS